MTIKSDANLLKRKKLHRFFHSEFSTNSVFNYLILFSSISLFDLDQEAVSLCKSSAKTCDAFAAASSSQLIHEGHDQS